MAVKLSLVVFKLKESEEKKGMRGGKYAHSRASKGEQESYYYYSKRSAEKRTPVEDVDTLHI